MTATPHVQQNSAPLLLQSASGRTVQVRIGPAGWSYPDWSGYVYPSRRAKDFHQVTYLAKFFDTIEINTSFYQPIRSEHAAQWLDRVAGNPRFLFTAKLWQKFTHDPPATSADVRAVCAGFDVLHGAGKLGAVLVQFPVSFQRSSETLAYLTTVLKHFADYPLTVEMRHASWNDPEFFDLLRSQNIAFCNIDQPVIGRSLAPSAEVTAPFGYVRLHGRRYDTWFSDDATLPRHERYNYLYSLEELTPWAERIRKMAECASEIFVLTNNHYRGKGVVNALELFYLLTGSNVNVPEPLVSRYPELEAIATKSMSPPTLFPLGIPSPADRGKL